MHQLAVALGLADPGDRALGLQKGIELFGKGDAVEAAVERLGVVFGLAKIFQLFEILVAEAPERGRVGLAAAGGKRNQDELARSLALPGGEMLFLGHRRNEDRSGDRGDSWGGPGDRERGWGVGGRGTQR